MAILKICMHTHTRAHIYTHTNLVINNGIVNEGRCPVAFTGSSKQLRHIYSRVPERLQVLDYLGVKVSGAVEVSKPLVY